MWRCVVKMQWQEGPGKRLRAGKRLPEDVGVKTNREIYWSTTHGPGDTRAGDDHDRDIENQSSEDAGNVLQTRLLAS